VLSTMKLGGGTCRCWVYEPEPETLFSRNSTKLWRWDGGQGRGANALSLVENTTSELSMREMGLLVGTSTTLRS